MVPSRFRIPAALISQGSTYLADLLDKRNPRNEEIEIEKKAQGGLIHLADGGGPKLPGKFGKAASVLGTALKPLSRAPAKSKAEIEAIAQRMAPQELGEFVKAPGKTTSVSGASKKQYDRELGLQHDIRNVVGTQGLPEIDYSKRIGDVAMMLPGDKSIVGDIHRVGDLQLEKAVRAEGGKGFPVNYALENPNVPPELWTSTGQVAKNYQNLGRKVSQEYGAENVLPHYANMPMGMGYSQHFADTLLRGLRPAGADLGKATDMMRTGSFKGKSFPDFSGFENMDEVYEMMKHNPELRQLFTNRIQVQDVAKGLGLPPTYGSDALHAVTSPSLRNLETGAGGHMVGRLDLQRQMTPSTHKGYIPDRDPGLNIPGEAIGKTPYATPYEMLYPDLLNDIRTNPITYENKTGKAMIVPEFGRLKMDSPRQVIDQQFVDEMGQYKEAMKKLTGKAAGGSIQGYADGKSVMSDIYKNIVPAQIRTFGETLMGDKSPLTEQNFTPDELNKIRQAIYQSRGRQEFDKNRKLLPDVKYNQSVGYKDYNVNQSENSRQDFNFGPNAAIRNTLGKFSYEKTPEGNLIAKDTYDFKDDLVKEEGVRRSSEYEGMGPLQKIGTLISDTMSPKGSINTLPSRVGSAFVGANGRPVEINLGKSPFKKGGKVKKKKK